MPGYRKLTRSASRDLYTVFYDERENERIAEKKYISRINARKKRENAQKRRKKLFKKTVSVAICLFVLFVAFPYSFRHYIADVFNSKIKPVLKVNYEKMLYPTYSYLYKDLFLGKYLSRDSKNITPLMKDIEETNERGGLKSSLESLASEYPSIKPSVYVWEYAGKSFVDIRANEVYPAASIIKIPVMIEMFREKDAGKFDLNESMKLEDYYRSGGSGKLKYAPGSENYTIDYLAEIMIENSDNSATNMITAKLGGMPEINRAMKNWGLKNTRMNNWLPDLEGTNVTTAREMAKMLYNLDVSNLISIESKKRAGYYMSHVKNNRLLAAGIPDNALILHKTGDIGHMLGDAGIVRTADGKKYIVVILAHRPYNSPKGKEFIVRASKLIYNNIAYM